MRGGLSFVISGLKSLKVIGRHRVRFHLDQLVMLQKQPVDGKYFWVCRMGEVDPHTFRTGVMCEGHGVNFETQIEAEDDALDHLINVHRAVGGERRATAGRSEPARARRRARRERRIEAWNDRRALERARGDADPGN